MTVRSSYLDAARENGTRQAVSRGLLLTAGGGSAGGTTTGTLVRFIDLDVGVAVTTSAERAEVIVHGETVWIPADPGAYVLGGPVVVVTDGTGRPVRVSGPAGTVPSVPEGQPSPVVVHRPDLVLDEGARQRNAEVAEDLAEAVADLSTASDLIETLRSLTGRKQWVGESFTEDHFTWTPLGSGVVRFQSAHPGNADHAWAVSPRPPEPFEGATADVTFPGPGVWEIEYETDDPDYHIENATITVTPEMMTADYGWADLTLPIDQLVQPGGPLDPETVAEGWVPVLSAAFAVVTEAIIAAEAIIDGAVQARHMDVVHELPSGARLSIQPDGIRMWLAGNTGPTPNLMLTAGDGLRILDDAGQTVAWLDPVEGLVLGDPDTDAGAQVSRRGLQTTGPDGDLAVQLGGYDRTGLTLYRDAEARAYMGDDGEVGGEVVSASEEFYYRGTELTDVLGQSSASVLTRFSFAGSQLSVIPGSGGYLDAVEVQFEMQAGRLYRIAARPINVLLGSASGDVAVSAALYWTKDGSRPTRSSERIFLDNWTPAAGTGQRATFDCERLAHGTGTTRVLLSLSAASRSLQVLDVASLYVEDLGPDPGVNDGTLRNFVRANEGDAAPPTAPPKTTRKPLELSASWVKSWQENGDSPGAIAGRAYQGRTPHYTTAGRYRSMVGFPSMTTTLNGADIDKIEVRVKPAHGGGTGGNMTVRLGTHGATSAPGSFASAATDLVSRTIKAGRSEWLTLPSSTHAGFRNGDLRGVVLYTTSVSAAEYGYVLPSGIDIRIHYRK